MRLCALFLILSAAGGSAASAQSLADVARKESERRQAVTGAGKTYTNSDLKPVREVSAPADAATAADVDKAGSASLATLTASQDEKAADAKDDAKEAKGTDEKADIKGQEYWSKHMAGLREQLDRDQILLDALQSRINALTTDFASRDDPAQRSQIANDRQKALTELGRLMKAVEQDKRAIPEFEEEARTSGVPAGWLR